MTKPQPTMPEIYESPAIQDIAPVSLLKGTDASGDDSNVAHDDEGM